jgi:hypothetical protein
VLAFGGRVRFGARAAGSIPYFQINAAQRISIGAENFALTATVAAQHAGPTTVLSFLLASVACALAGLCSQ